MTYAIGVTGTAIPEEASAPLSRRVIYSITRVVWTGIDESDFLLGSRRVCERSDDDGEVSDALRRRDVREQNERLNSSKACSI